MVDRRPSSAALIYWASEREAIRKRKEQGVEPWTTDPILAKYRFTNLRRRDVRVSQWLIRNVLSKSVRLGWWSFVQFTALCRWVNWPPTIAAIMEEGLWPQSKLDLRAIGDFIDQRCASGLKTWTGAYMIRAPKPALYGDMGKGRFVAEVVIGDGLASVHDSLERAIAMKQQRLVWEALTKAKYWGRFMAGQVVTDWTYTPMLERAGDLCAWAPQGPGSIRGYNRLMGNPLKQSVPEDVWCSQLKVWRHQIIRALGPEYVTLTLMDIQNALCETDKMLRVAAGEGRPRATYKPETEY